MRIILGKIQPLTAQSLIFYEQACNSIINFTRKSAFKPFWNITILEAGFAPRTSTTLIITAGVTLTEIQAVANTGFSLTFHPKQTIIPRLDVKGPCLPPNWRGRPSTGSHVAACTRISSSFPLMFLLTPGMGFFGFSQRLYIFHTFESSFWACLYKPQKTWQCAAKAFFLLGALCLCSEDCQLICEDWVVASSLQRAFWQQAGYSQTISCLGLSRAPSPPQFSAGEVLAGVEEWSQSWGPRGIRPTPGSDAWNKKSLIRFNLQFAIAPSLGTLCLTSQALWSTVLFSIFPL